MVLSRRLSVERIREVELIESLSQQFLMELRPVDRKQGALDDLPAAIMPFKFPAVHDGAMDPVSCRRTMIWKISLLALVIQMNNL